MPSDNTINAVEGIQLKDSTIKAISISDFYEFYFRTFYKEGNVRELQLTRRANTM